MKILMLYPRWTGEYGLFATFAQKAAVYPPNLIYLAAIAEQLGHEVKIIDGQAENISENGLVEYALEFAPDIIGLTVATPFAHIVYKLAEKLKQRIGDITIIIGGPHITALKEGAFSPVFDYAFVGEADESFPAFLKTFEKGEDISGIKGILWRVGGKVKFTGDVTPVYDLDALPVPARHLLEVDKYKIGTLHGTKVFASILTVRGCPFKCIFCSTQVSGNTIRKRSPRLVVDEVVSIINGYGIRHFIILDDTLTLDRRHIMEICDLIIEEKLDITFEGSTRANLVDEELVSNMAEAGLIRLSFGLESIDENIRRIMRKEVPLETYITANKLTNKYSIETLNSCMIGLPGESYHTVKKTLSFLRNFHEIKQANISIAVPYPGTELYEMAARGDYGINLETNDFAKFRRYNSAVMSVGDLSPNELIRLQNDAFASIYIAWWRFLPLFRKSGIVGVLLTFGRVVKSIIRGRWGLLMVDKNYWAKKV